MKKFDIVLLTDSRYINPKKVTKYVQNILDEDRLVISALEKRGLKVVRKDWADPNFDWSSTKFAIFRTTWDYFNRFEEFLDWINHTQRQLIYINPVESILWNVDKHYLQDLSTHGVNIPETRFIEFGESIKLVEILKSNGWDDVILKPAISASARHTYRLNLKNHQEFEPVFQSLIKTEAMLLQAFVKSVVERGEVALMFFNGEYSHAVLKRAKKGDFRVQDDFGGTVHDYTPTKEEVALSKQALKVCNPTPVYARVDILDDNHGSPAVTELELIEPELWFRNKPESATLFADAILTHIEKKND